MALRRHGWLWFAVFALFAAQTLGLLHRTVHLPQAPALHAVQGAGHGADLAGLFAGHGETSDCRLYDQLGHGDALPVLPALALPFVVPAFVLHETLGQALARWAALFDARGPPAVR